MNCIGKIGSAFGAAMLGFVCLGHCGQASAATIAVRNCNDEGDGSLREAVRTALSGDTIDLRNLACTKITLINGHVIVNQSDLYLRGPGFRKLSISGNLQGSVFRHFGDGTLRLSGMTVEDGVWTDTYANRALAEGGCIFSRGSVSLYDVEVRHCAAAAYFPDGTANGGGIYAGRVTAQHSAIYSNVARGNGTGGGIHAAYVVLYRTKIRDNHAMYAAGMSSVYGVEMDYSTVSRNHALRYSGGFRTDYVVHISNSTISNNSAGRLGGGFTNATSTPSSTVIVNSTISGNVARDASAAFIVGGASVVNSTIAFNRRKTGPGQHPSGALDMGTDPTGSGSGHLLLISSILANNTVDGQPDIDFFVRDAQMHMLGEYSVVLGSNAPLPADTIRADPMLAPLGDNGGRTWTHALLDRSPAIDRGNNEAGLLYDQRGIGFPRVQGASADIGSYER